MDHRIRRTVIAACAILLSAAAPAAGPTYTDAQRRLMADAEAAYDRGDMMSALPIFERLADEIPESAAVAERLAMCLMVKFENLPASDERLALIERTRREANRARLLGDHSDLLAVIFEAVDNPGAGQNTMNARMSAAESAFSRGDFDTALASYIEIAGANPGDYNARLFAGDVYFRKGDAALAGEWFQKAIDIDPNREQAYRYWGDALLKSGRPEDALSKMIEAVVAEPYVQRTWGGLHNWSEATKTPLRQPQIVVPRVSDKPGSGAVIELDAQMLKSDPATTAAWMAYALMRRMWRETEFAKAFPDEKEYRHSLAEEIASLKTAIAALSPKAIADPKLDASARTLVELDHDGLLEPYVLLSAPDRGIAHDYGAYRDRHRAALRRYLERYVAGRAAASGAN